VRTVRTALVIGLALLVSLSAPTTIADACRTRGPGEPVSVSGVTARVLEVGPGGIVTVYLTNRTPSVLSALEAEVTVWRYGALATTRGRVPLDLRPYARRTVHIACGPAHWRDLPLLVRLTAYVGGEPLDLAVWRGWEWAALSTVYPLDQGYVEKLNGQTITVTLPKGTVISARAKFRGSQTSEVQTSYNAAYGAGSAPGGSWNEGYLTLPAVPSGYTFYYHWAYLSVSANTPGEWHADIKLPSEDWDLASGNGTTGSNSDTSSQNDVGNSVTLRPYHQYDYNHSAEVRTYGKKTVYTQTSDPSISIGGVTVASHSGTLNNDVESAWYDIDIAKLAADADNVFAVSVGGSGQVDVWLEITVITGLEVLLDSPVNYATVPRGEAVFYLTALPDTADTNTVWWPRLQFDPTSSGFASHSTSMHSRRAWKSAGRTSTVVPGHRSRIAVTHCAKWPAPSSLRSSRATAVITTCRRLNLETASASLSGSSASTGSGLPP